MTRSKRNIEEDCSFLLKFLFALGGHTHSSHGRVWERRFSGTNGSHDCPEYEWVSTGAHCVFRKCSEVQLGSKSNLVSCSKSTYGHEVAFALLALIPQTPRICKCTIPVITCNWESIFVTVGMQSEAHSLQSSSEFGPGGQGRHNLSAPRVNICWDHTNTHTRTRPRTHTHARTQQTGAGGLLRGSSILSCLRILPLSVVIFHKMTLCVFFEHLQSRSLVALCRTNVLKLKCSAKA